VHAPWWSPIDIARSHHATIVTKNYPDDAQSRWEEAARWRLNIHVGSEPFADSVGYPPESIADRNVDFSQTDAFSR